MDAALVCAAGPTVAQTVPEGFSVEIVHERPGVKSLGFALLPDERILGIGHQNGEVRLLVDGRMKVEPVATIPELAYSSERGLLGIAVDPDFPASPFVYLYYTSTAGVNRVSKFETKGALDDPTSDNLTIDLATEQNLLELQDDSRFHNGGTLRFGSDMTLYVSHGDDENWKEGDPAHLQDLTNPYGKILRIRRGGRQSGLSRRAGRTPSRGLRDRPPQSLPLRDRPPDGPPVHRRHRHQSKGGAQSVGRRRELRLPSPRGDHILPGEPGAHRARADGAHSRLSMGTQHLCRGHRARHVSPEERSERSQLSGAFRRRPLLRRLLRR